jgi:gluconate 2-dehydrogenase gamma chain
MVADPTRNFDGQRRKARSILAAGYDPRGESNLNEKETSRRQFLQASGGALGAGWLALNWPQVAAAAQHAHAAAMGEAPRELKLLTPAEARDVEAIAAQIVPSGATAGAREAGVVYFVDHIHAGLYAAHADAFRAGLAAFQQDVTKAHPDVGSFADLSESSQLEYLKSIERTPFFERMRFLTVLGLLALPSHGGNRDKSGWKMVGFVDQHAWEPPFGHYDVDYPGFKPFAKEPRS